MTCLLCWLFATTRRLLLPHHLPSASDKAGRGPRASSPPTCMPVSRATWPVRWDELPRGRRCDLAVDRSVWRGGIPDWIGLTARSQRRRRNLGGQWRCGGEVWYDAVAMRVGVDRHGTECIFKVLSLNKYHTKVVIFYQGCPMPIVFLYCIVGIVGVFVLLVFML